MSTPIIPQTDNEELVDLEVEVHYEDGDVEYFETYDRYTNSNRISIDESFDSGSREFKTVEELKEAGIVKIEIYETTAKRVEWSAEDG